MPFKDPEKKKTISTRISKIKQRAHKWTTKTKWKCQTVLKKYYEENIYRLNEKHNCGCGGCYATKNKRAHERGKAHIYWPKTGIIPNTLPVDYNWYPHLFKLMKEDNLNKAWVFINWFYAMAWIYKIL